MSKECIHGVPLDWNCNACSDECHPNRIMPDTPTSDERQDDEQLRAFVKAAINNVELRVMDKNCLYLVDEREMFHVLKGGGIYDSPTEPLYPLQQVVELIMEHPELFLRVVGNGAACSSTEEIITLIQGEKG